MRTGIIFALITCFLWGLTPLFDRLAAAKASPVTMLTVRFTTVFFCILPLYLSSKVRSEIMSLDRATLGYIVIAAILSAFAGIYVYFNAVSRLESSIVMPIVAIFPVVTFVLGAAFLKEEVTYTKIFGTILTVCGVILVSL